jgi:hypothetical protein
LDHDLHTIHTPLSTFTSSPSFTFKGISAFPSLQSFITYIRKEKTKSRGVLDEEKEEEMVFDDEDEDDTSSSESEEEEEEDFGDVEPIEYYINTIGKKEGKIE